MACCRYFIPRGYSTKFYTGKPCPEVHILTYPHTCLTEKVLLSYTVPSLSAVEGWGGLLQALYPQGVLNKVLRGSPAPRSMSLPFHIPFLTEKVLLSYTIPSLLAVEGWSGLLQAFYPQGVLNKFLRGSPAPRLTAVKRSSMRNSLVSGAGRGNFPPEILIETIAETAVKQSIVEQSSEIR